MIITPKSGFRRPANTTQYAAGDLVANSDAAAGFTPMEFDLGNVTSGVIGFVRMFKSGSTATLATFSLHLFTKMPVVTSGGDNEALTIDGSRDLIGTIACDMSTGSFTYGGDLSKRFQVLQGTNPSLFAFDLGSIRNPKLYGLLEATAAYTPASAEEFMATLEIGDDATRSIVVDV